MKILMADDEHICRKLMTEHLSNFGKCDSVENGDQVAEAVEKALESGKYYDLICLDIMMPKMDGQTALKIIRELESKYDIPEGDGAKIIMMSALGDHDNIITAFHEQCDAYLVKPIKFETLKAKLKELELI